ncbi:MAG: hypothetical protein K9N09_09275 [Candidatus Cloacimonetes bacterium]|nr:hypothetical protein [Candidatus Cloacimonadota bacterium]MCF7814292.1 hypothetical protein [Candidatus Cloacimonadota bacterium]MCF7868879.1 hypothetical protein [Candidatus Cloacimonadota bacterium]MCF7884333.1 hypothetical protein [Candidatus Cloacimonadota bacterium]
MNFKYIAVLLILILVIACSLDYENPLDPNNSGIDVPPKVRGLNVVLTWQDSVYITWHPITNSQIDGYYLYRSLDENGYYRPLTEANLSPVDTLYKDSEVNIVQKEYWYKISAFKAVADTVLEGYRSEPETWN